MATVGFKGLNTDIRSVVLVR